MMKRSVPSTKQLIQYSVLAAPVAFAGYPLYVLAPDFYATQYGVSLSVLAIALLLLRAFDAVQDPLIGAMSDRFTAFVPAAMVISSALLVFSVFALFNPLGANPVIWFSLFMALAVSAYSVLSINLNVLGMLWTENKDEQTSIAGAREAFGLVGLLLAVTMPGILVAYVPADDVYIWFSGILAVLMVFALVAFYRWLRHLKPTVGQARPAVNIVATLRALPVVTHQLYLVYGLSVLASSIPAVLVIFFIRDGLHADAYTGLFLLLYFLSGALAMPLWKKLSTKYGKYEAWLMSILLAVVSFIGAYFLGAGNVWPYAIICIASGTALGGDLVLPPSLLADHIHDGATEESAATQFSILALLTKAGLAIGTAITLPLLDVAGFVPNAANSAQALNYLSVAYALIPCLIKLSAAYLVYRFFIRTYGKHNHETSLENTITVGSSDHGI